eukprot:scaffold878_cov271-Pinguiococcus_pyrenoidosus.AAC.26
MRDSDSRVECIITLQRAVTSGFQVSAPRCARNICCYGRDATVFFAAGDGSALHELPTSALSALADLRLPRRRRRRAVLLLSGGSAAHLSAANVAWVLRVALLHFRRGGKSGKSGRRRKTGKGRRMKLRRPSARRFAFVAKVALLVGDLASAQRKPQPVRVSPLCVTEYQTLSSGSQVRRSRQLGGGATTPCARPAILLPDPCSQPSRLGYVHARPMKQRRCGGLRSARGPSPGGGAIQMLLAGKAASFRILGFLCSSLSQLTAPEVALRSSVTRELGGRLSARRIWPERRRKEQGNEWRVQHGEGHRGLLDSSRAHSGSEDGGCVSRAGFAGKTLGRLCVGVSVRLSLPRLLCGGRLKLSRTFEWKSEVPAR